MRERRRRMAHHRTCYPQEQVRFSDSSSSVGKIPLPAGPLTSVASGSVHTRVRFRAPLPADVRVRVGEGRTPRRPSHPRSAQPRIREGASRPARGIDAPPAPSYYRRHEAAPDPQQQADNGRATSLRKPEGQRTRARCPGDDLASCQEHVRELLRLQRRRVTPFPQSFRLAGSGSRCRPRQEPATCSRGLRAAPLDTADRSRYPDRGGGVPSVFVALIFLKIAAATGCPPARTRHGRGRRQPGEAVPCSGRTS
jgi:hypothetical protein